MKPIWKPYNAPKTKEEAMERQWLPVDVAAEQWGLTVSYLEKLFRAAVRGIENGIDPKGVVKIGNQWKVRPEAMEEFYTRPKRRSYVRRFTSLDKTVK